MTNELLLHPTTADQLATIVQKPPHALLITGPIGMGTSAIAELLAAELLNIPLAKVAQQPFILHIAPEAGKAISIEAIRELEHFISLKVAPGQAINRVILIHNANTMGTEAQNALLKTLEEPPAGTMLLLTAPSAADLLPTVRSRVQVLEVLRPTEAAMAAYLTQQGATAAELPRILALSGGLPGLAWALQSGDETHPLVAAAGTARELLQQSTFDKLKQVEALAKNREATRNVLYILMQMAHAALLTGNGTERWQRVLRSAYDAQEQLEQSVQPKLALTNLMLSL